MNVRERVWEIIEVARPGDGLSRGVDSFILILIFANVIAVIVGSVPSIYARYGAQLDVFEVFSVAIFSVEYLSRIWACTVDSRFAGPVWGRLKFARQPMSIIDLAAILPFYLPFFGFDLRSLRVLRLLRLLRVAKIGRYYASLTVIKNVFRSKKEELVLTFALMVMLLVVSSSVIYFCENGENPEMFSSIPATMWWAVETLTTVGYGDMYPTTDLGKLFASFIAILGIGMFALPTGILGAGFVEEIQKSKAEAKVCPHCGEQID